MISKQGDIQFKNFIVNSLTIEHSSHGRSRNAVMHTLLACSKEQTEKRGKPFTFVMPKIS